MSLILLAFTDNALVSEILSRILNKMKVSLPSRTTSKYLLKAYYSSSNSPSWKTERPL